LVAQFLSHGKAYAECPKKYRSFHVDRNNHTGQPETPSWIGEGRAPRPSRVAEAVAARAPRQPLQLVFAIPDHPWVDSADSAAVRIAMTVGSATENGLGMLSTVEAERDMGGEGLEVELVTRHGLLHADLRIGANVASAGALRANGGLSSPGFKLHGAGFIVTPEEAAQLDSGAPIKEYRNGRDLTDRPRGVKVIDLFGLTAEVVRSRYPATYQWVYERVKPERDAKGQTKDGSAYAKLWWLFGKPRQELRKYLIDLPRFIATVETAKYRTFQFLEADMAPDNKLICIALNGAYFLGVLSSSVHVTWGLACGSTLGPTPVYVKSRCFETFPFPAASPEQQTCIRALAEQLDAHRKARQAADPALTLTGMYNVLAKLRAGEVLTAKDKAIHQSGLVSVLQTLHDELDAAVLEAYGWSDLLPAMRASAAVTSAAMAEQRAAADVGFTETILERLVALNAERQREEATGLIRWLRPDFQNPQSQRVAVDAENGSKNDAQSTSTAASSGQSSAASGTAEKFPWPPTLPEQVALLVRLLTLTPQSESQLASQISGRGPWKKRLPDLLQTLVALGRARQEGETWRAV
jgi:hypothetical protein